MTIEERAEEYSKTSALVIVKDKESNCDIDESLRFEKILSYKKGAKEQQNIDIDKACEWLKRELAEPMPDELYQQWCEEKLADFRKAMADSK